MNSFIKFAAIKVALIYCFNPILGISTNLERYYCQNLMKEKSEKVRMRKIQEINEKLDGKVPIKSPTKKSIRFTITKVNSSDNLDKKNQNISNTFLTGIDNTYDSGNDVNKGIVLIFI